MRHPVSSNTHRLEQAADAASVAILARLEAGLPIDPRDLQAIADLLLYGSARRGQS